MSTLDSFVQGTVFYQGNLAALAGLFAEHGLHPTVGPWAIRFFEPPSRFQIAYVGNLSPDAPFEVSVDGYEVSFDIIAEWCELVAGCLRGSGIRFKMTHFTADQKEICDYE